jgi:hypothetical protein
MSGGDVKVFISFLMIYIMHSLSILHLEQVEWAGGGEHTQTRDPVFLSICSVRSCNALVCVFKRVSVVTLARTALVLLPF